MATPIISKGIDRRIFLKSLAAACALFGLPACSNKRPDISHGLPTNAPSTSSELPITQLDSTGKIKRDVILLAMPGNWSFVGSGLASLTEMSFASVAENTVMVGDGRSDITPLEIETGLNNAMARFASTGNDITIIVMGRGEQLNGDRGVVINYASPDHPSKEKIISYEQLIATFIKAGKHISDERKVGLFLTTCYGNSALKFGPTLPHNYSMGSCTHQDGPTNPADQIRLYYNLSNNHLLAGDLSPEALIKSHLVTQNNPDNPPLLYLADKGYINPLGYIEDRLGKPFSDREKVDIYNKLAPFFDPALVHKTLKMISGAKTATQLKDVFGPAMHIGMLYAKPTAKFPEMLLIPQDNMTKKFIGMKVHDGIAPTPPYKPGTCDDPKQSIFGKLASLMRQQCGM